jgi:hypothetical protein
MINAIAVGNVMAAANCFDLLLVIIKSVADFISLHSKSKIQSLLKGARIILIPSLTH